MKYCKLVRWDDYQSAVKIATSLKRTVLDILGQLNVK